MSEKNDLLKNIQVENDYFTDPTDHPLADWEINMRTREMGIGDNGPLVDRAYSESLPFQFDRECVKNSIEAKAKTIKITPDWVHVKDSKGGVYRYMISDDGKGMTGEELVKFFNMISSSGKIMDAHGNFGVGAKISLLPWNPNGLVVMSWKNGVGKMVKIIKKPNGNYALYRWDVLDEEGMSTGTRADYVDAPEEYRPKWITQSGTVIVATGATGNDDTFLGPNADATIKAHIHALNTRFFLVPEEISISVFEFTRSEKDCWPKKDVNSISDGGMYRQVRGAKHYLDEYAKASGVCLLGGAKAHWWIRGEQNGKGNIHSYAYERGFVSALYDNELYNSASNGPEGRQRYLSFGILQDTVQKQITIIIEPDKLIKGTVEGVYPNTARSRLLYSGGELPWDRWGREFMDSMPAEIQELIEETSGTAYSPKDLAERLKPFLKRMQSSNYVPVEAGKLHTLPNTRKGKAHRKLGTKINCTDIQKTSTVENPEKENPENKSNAAKLNPEGQPSRRVNPKSDLPVIRWVSIEDSTRSPGELEERAAEYAENAHTLTINADFFLFQQQIRHWANLYAGLPGVINNVRDIVREVYSAELCLRVMQARSLEGSPTWDPGKFSQLTSMEALTFAVFGYIGADAQIASRAGGLFGAAAKLLKNRDSKFG